MYQYSLLRTNMDKLSSVLALMCERMDRYYGSREWLRKGKSTVDNQMRYTFFSRSSGEETDPGYIDVDVVNGAI